MAARTPSQIYAILAYSKSLNRTKQEFDQDALLAPYKHTTDLRLANLKAESFATRLNRQKHGGATDWVAKPKLQDYRPDAQTRANQIITPQSLVRPNK